MDEVKDKKKKDIKTEINFNEISLTGSVYAHGKGIQDYNPDSLVGKKGLEIYSKMREDDQVKAVLTMKKFARLMTPWEIQPASEDSKDVEIANFVKKNLDVLVGTFEDVLLGIYTALDYGYSISEKIWYKIEKGEFAGKIGLKAIKTREPFYYGFESDNFGNLRDDGIVYLGAVPADLISKAIDNKIVSRTGYGYRLPTDKFVVFSYSKEFSNWYGRSDLRAAYRSWWSKEVLIRFMNIYMERFGMPTHVAKYPKNMGKVERGNLKEVLDKVQAKYSIVIPSDVEIELLNVGGGGESGYKSAIEMHNKFISRSILVPDLIGFTESTGGAYALGKKHFDVFLWILQNLGRNTEEAIVGEQIIKQLVDYNYNDVDKYPKFKFESITAEGTATRANIIQMGINGGFINPQEEWIREYLALPKADKKYPLGLGQIKSDVVPQEGLKTEEGLKDDEDKLVDELLKQEEVEQYDDDEDIEWITVQGRHIPIQKGLSGKERSESIREKLEGKGKRGKKERDFLSGERINSVEERKNFLNNNFKSAISRQIGERKQKQFTDDNVSSLLIEDIKPNPEQQKVLDMYRVRTMLEKINRGEELQPIKIDKENNIIDGHHRLAAYKLAGREEIPVEIVEKYQKENGLIVDKRFAYKVDFKKIKSDLEEYEFDTIEELSEIIKKQKESLVHTVEKKKIIENKDYDAINALQLKFVGDFKDIIEKRLVKLYLDSKLQMLKELEKSTNGNIEVVTKFAELTIQTWIPVRPTEAIDFFNKKVLVKIITKDGVKKLLTLANRKLLEYYSAKAFAVAGIEKEKILSQAKIILLNAIKEGKPTEAVFGLGKLFDSYLTTGELKDEELVTPNRLETIVRTNFSEAMNEGRRSMLDLPEIKTFVPYRQYIAIMDDRVRESHAEMHNRIYRSDNPIWEKINPPNGFNCRCSVIGITQFDIERLTAKGEGIELADDLPLPEDFPDKGFGKYGEEIDTIKIRVYDKIENGKPELVQK